MNDRYGDLSGQVFGPWTVDRLGSRVTGKDAVWICICPCGREQSIKQWNLVSGIKRVPHCRLCRKESFLFRDYPSEHNSWKCMRARCYQPKTDGYERYGGRGVTVCDRWRNSFNAFLEDMKPKATPDLTIERLNNSGHYEPGNCVWASPIDQSANREVTIFMTVKGITKPLTAWCRELGLTRFVVWGRLKKGWSHEQALSTSNFNLHELSWNGQSHSIKKWSSITGINYGALKMRVQKGWTTERALTTQVEARFSNKKAAKGKT